MHLSFKQPPPLHSPIDKNPPWVCCCLYSRWPRGLLQIMYVVVPILSQWLVTCNKLLRDFEQDKSSDPHFVSSVFQGHIWTRFFLSPQRWVYLCKQMCLNQKFHKQMLYFLKNKVKYYKLNHIWEVSLWVSDY